MRKPSAVALLAFACIVAPATSLRAQETKKLRVKASELLDRVEIIGQLGVPIRRVVRISGEWFDEERGPKNSTLWLRVTRVEGAEQKELIELNLDDVRPICARGKFSESTRVWTAHWTGKQDAPKPRPGEAWELLGYEMGGIAGFPDEAGKYFEMSIAAASPKRGFITDFVFIAARKAQRKADTN